MIEEYRNGTLEDLLTQAQVKLKDDAHLQGSEVDRYICSGLVGRLYTLDLQTLPIALALTLTLTYTLTLILADKGALAHHVPTLMS